MLWTSADRDKRFHNNGVGDKREEAERDRDRLLYSSAFQRLAGITQIVRAGEAGIFHTRQQHTIKVAQVGRRLAQRLLKEQKKRTSTLIGTYIGAVDVNPRTKEPKAVIFDQSKVDEVRILKQITRDYVIASPTLAAQQHGQQRIIRDLYEALIFHADKDTGFPAFLPIRLRYLRPMAGTSPARFVADCIASLSEAEALGLHARLTGMASGSVLDPIVR